VTVCFHPIGLEKWRTFSRRRANAPADAGPACTCPALGMKRHRTDPPGQARGGG
jgi:hypothetical protein